MNNEHFNDVYLLKLINLVKKYPAIWNKSSPEYNDRMQKNISWQKIADEMEFSLASVKQMYEGLRQTYCIEVKIKQKNPKYKSTWKFYKKLDSLLGDNSKRCLVSVRSSAGEENIWLEDFDTSDTSVADESATDEHIVWNTKTQHSLIKILEKNPILLELRPNSRENAKREELWQKVAKELGCDVKAVKQQKKFLTERFNADYKKALENPNYKPTWKHYEALLFLANIDPLTLSERQTDGELEFALEHDEETRNKFQQEENVANESIFVDHVDSVKKNELPIDLEERQEVQLMNKGPKIQAKTRDEYTIFGETVANEMRQMNDFKSIQTTFKKKVLKILLEAKKRQSFKE